MKKYYSLVSDDQSGVADLYIFGDIVDAWNTGLDEAWDMDLGEVSGLSIVKELKELSASQINVHINSCGGYTSEGLTIYNVLKNHSAKIITYCDGFACSAASLVFMAGDERVMGDASVLMIHNAWSDVQGNAAQLRQQADILEQISKAAGNAYAGKVNISREELDAMLDGENHEGTWILPEDAVKMGFATKIAEEDSSNIANQSVMKQIMQKVLGKPQQKEEPITFDYDKMAEIVSAKLIQKSEQEFTANSPKMGISNFLNALSRREEQNK